jgi:flagellar motor switch protein FliN/FliY
MAQDVGLIDDQPGLIGDEPGLIGDEPALIGDDTGLIGDEGLALGAGPGGSADALFATPASAAPAFNAPEFRPLAGESYGGDGAGIDLLLDVSLEVSVELGRTRMTIGELLALRPGSVIELDKLAGEPADILVNGTRIARGEVVVVDEKFGVRVLEVVSPARRLATMG